MPDPAKPSTRRSSRLLARLSEPLDTTAAPGAAPVETPAAGATSAERHTAKQTRAAANSAAVYTRRVQQAAASGDPGHALMAHVDFIRASRDPNLIQGAADALAQLIKRKAPRTE